MRGQMVRVPHNLSHPANGLANLSYQLSDRVMRVAHITICYITGTSKEVANWNLNLLRHSSIFSIQRATIEQSNQFYSRICRTDMQGLDTTAGLTGSTNSVGIDIILGGCWITGGPVDRVGHVLIRRRRCKAGTYSTDDDDIS